MPPPVVVGHLQHRETCQFEFLISVKENDEDKDKAELNFKSNIPFIQAPRVSAHMLGSTSRGSRRP